MAILVTCMVIIASEVANNIREVVVAIEVVGNYCYFTFMVAHKVIISFQVECSFLRNFSFEPFYFKIFLLLIMKD